MVPVVDQARSPAAGAAPPGRFAANVMHFARVLRTAGLPVGPGKVLDALRAVEAVGIGSRTDFYWTLHAARRVAEALGPEKLPGEGEAPDDAEPPAVELDATQSFSAREVLQHKDFEQMSAAEVEQAKALIRKLRLPIKPVPTRRFRRDPSGWRVDLRRTLRQSLRGGGAMIDLARKRRVRRHPPLVILSDISGSMERYARMLLHFMHAATSDRDRVHSFVFGTRLTNVTRQLRARDVD
ncbi:MAG: uncharacterized protein K0R41_2095, partial [Geminicoccaceae bacterium]|nr:uncharacterized protein [Geminicoccaceae bacterium]